MKRSKRLTRQQKILLAKLGYDPKKYRLLNELDETLVLLDKEKSLPVVVYKAGK